MKYTWDVKEIRSDIKLLEKLTVNEQDPDKNELIASFLELSKNRLKVFSGTEFDYEDMERENLELDVIANLFIEDVDKSDENIGNILLNSWKVVKDVKENYIPATTIVCSNERLLEYNDMFFRSCTPKNVLKQYLTYIKENPNYLHITKYHKGLQIYGNTYIDSILRKKRIVLYRENNFMDLVSLPHELFHVIFNNYNYYDNSNNQMYYSHEVEGSFANLLVADFFSDKMSLITRESNYAFLDTYKELIKQLLVYQAYRESSKNGHFKRNKFDKYLNVFGLNEPIPTDEVKKMLYTQASDIITYTLSYLVSLDLFSIYKQDRELSFYLLKNIVYNPFEKDLIKCLRRNHITFMDDEYTNLKKHIKKIESK